MKGKKLLKAAEAENLPFKVVPCKCLGKCKKGPNGMARPGNFRLHRLTLEELRRLGSAVRPNHGLNRKGDSGRS